jgi:hypothetical protein
MHLSAEELDALVLGELGPVQAAAAEEHAAGCAMCGRELAQACAERAMFAQRAAPDVAALWPRVEERIAGAAARSNGAAALENGAAAARPGAAAAPRSRWVRRAALAAAAAAACVLYAAYAPRLMHAPALEPAESVDPRALAALDRAEGDYRKAASVLEAEYERARLQLDPALAQRWDATLAVARTQLGGAQALAADDVRARLQIIDGYAGYVRSLREIVEEATQ